MELHELLPKRKLDDRNFNIIPLSFLAKNYDMAYNYFVN